MSVVLVHGAFHGPWCWDEVRRGLESRGIPTVVPNLPFTGVLNDAAEARTAIDRAARQAPVLVCGHSYGGRVISLAASGHPAVRQLVYMTAVQTEETAHLGNEDAPTGVMTAFRTRSDGALYLDPEIASPYFFHDCDPEITEASKAKLRSMTVGPTVPVPDGTDSPPRHGRKSPQPMSSAPAIASSIRTRSAPWPVMPRMSSSYRQGIRRCWRDQIW